MSELILVKIQTFSNAFQNDHFYLVKVVRKKKIFRDPFLKKSLVENNSYVYVYDFPQKNFSIGLISSFSNFLTSLSLVRFFRLIAPRWPSTAAGAVSLKNLTKREEVRKLEKELIRLIVSRHLFHYFWPLKKLVC